MGCGESKNDDDIKPPPLLEMPEYKIIVVGDSNVGKTAIIHQYVQGSF